MPTTLAPVQDNAPCCHAAELAVRDALVAKILELQGRVRELEAAAR